MTPFSFDPTTARLYIGDAQARIIEQEARAEAELQIELPKITGVTYAELLLKTMQQTCYLEARRIRRARLQRKKHDPT